MSPAQPRALPLACALAALAAACPSRAATPPPGPVPLFQAIPLPRHQISFQRDGRELCRAHFDPALQRPFLFPLIGPSGRSLTRMGHPHDPEGHGHHTSVWIGHRDVGGTSFWEPASPGRIVHQKIERIDDADDGAGLVTINDWIDGATGRRLLVERRAIRCQPLERGEWILLLDLRLEAVAPEGITLGKTPFGLLGVRVAKTVSVNDGGGTIRDSEGRSGEPAILWKRARWVDCSGPVTRSAIEGVTLLDHPSNPEHPTPFHVRADGWMCASLTTDHPRPIPHSAPLHLRYGLYIHSDAPAAGAIERRWRAFAEAP